MGELIFYVMRWPKQYPVICRLEHGAIIVAISNANYLKAQSPECLYYVPLAIPLSKLIIGYCTVGIDDKGIAEEGRSVQFL